MPRGLPGIPKSPEHRAKIATAHLGHTLSQESRDKISKSKTGVPMTEEHRAAQTERLRRNPPNKGKKMSEEARLHLSAVRSGSCDILQQYGISSEEYKAQILAGNKWCFFRRHFAPSAEFKTRTGVCSACKSDWYRVSDLRSKYGVTPEWYDKKMAEQGGACGVCARIPSPDERNFSVDHNHITGAVRGVLCGPCNTLLERLDKTPEWMRRALAYLDRYAALDLSTKSVHN
jgi:Recombination endonuclease VII/NUMOD3 motif